MLKNAIEVIFVFRDHYHKLSLTLPEVIALFFHSSIGSLCVGPVTAPPGAT